MRQAPPWLAERMAAVCPSGPVLWVGAELAFPEEPPVTRLAEDAEPNGARYPAVFVASVPGDLRGRMRRLRAVCASGAEVVLLLPQPGAGVRGALGALLGPLGRSGREPRALCEQCEALLAMGAQGVRVERDDGGRSFVRARLPEAPSALDAAFEAAVE